MREHWNHWWTKVQGLKIWHHPSCVVFQEEEDPQWRVNQTQEQIVCTWWTTNIQHFLGIIQPSCAMVNSQDNTHFVTHFKVESKVNWFCVGLSTSWCQGPHFHEDPFWFQGQQTRKVLAPIGKECVWFKGCRKNMESTFEERITWKRFQAKQSWSLCFLQRQFWSL